MVISTVGGAANGSTVTAVGFTLLNSGSGAVPSASPFADRSLTAPGPGPTVKVRRVPACDRTLLLHRSRCKSAEPGRRMATAFGQAYSQLMSQGPSTSLPPTVAANSATLVLNQPASRGSPGTPQGQIQVRSCCNVFKHCKCQEAMSYASHPQRPGRSFVCDCTDGWRHAQR